MHSYIAYIDESGDDGCDKFREPGADGGASTFLGITACVLRATNDLEAVKWRDEIKQKSGKKTKGRSIHFANFNHSQKKAACQSLAERPLKFITAISYKPSIPSDKYAAKNSLYFYVTRYVIERLSWFCRDMRRHVPEGNGQVKIIFSRRGGMSYPGFQSYMELLKDGHQTTVHWPVIDIEAIEALDHSRRAGLQLADCGARAIAEAIEPDRFGNVEGQYLSLLSEKIYERKGNYLSYGLKLIPSLDGMNLNSQQAANLSAFK